MGFRETPRQDLVKCKICYPKILTANAPPLGMSMEDDLIEYSISGTETFVSDQDIKYYCDELPSQQHMCG